jgi:hypothetical protein
LALAHRLAGALLLAGWLPACGSCGQGSAVPDAGGPAAVLVEPPVPAPDGLLAEAWIRTPDATWEQLQQDVSGVVALLPPSAAEAMAALAGLDPRVARFVDGKGTWVAVIASSGSTADVAWAAALPLTDPALAAATLLDARDAQGGARVTAHTVAGMRVLGGDAGARPQPMALVGQWLVVASSEAELARLGPYAYRTMPTKVAPGAAPVVASVPGAVLAGVVSAQLSAKWEALRSWLVARDDEERAAHGGRPPDFGDPRAILDAADAVVRRRIALLAQGSAARVELATDDGDVRADVLLTPGAGDAGSAGLAALRPGEAKPLAEVPADAIVAILSRDDAESRTDDAREIEAALDRAFGSRARPDDTAAVHAAIDDWARARGEWITAALSWGTAESARGLWLCTPAASGDGASRAVRELVDLSHRHALGDLLSGKLHVAPSVVAPADVPAVPKASLATFAVTGVDKRARSSPPIGVAWGLHDGDLLVAAGGAATGLLAVQAAPARRLGDDPRTARVIKSLGADVVFAAIAQPLRFDPLRGAGDAGLAPAVLAWGRRGSDAWLRVELGGTLIRELVRLKAGL